MSDIVERLRAYAKNQGGWHNIDETCEAAADELTTLREKSKALWVALATVMGTAEHGQHMTWEERCLRARKALEAYQCD